MAGIETSVSLRWAGAKMSERTEREEESWEWIICSASNVQWALTGRIGGVQGHGGHGLGLLGSHIDIVLAPSVAIE